MQQVPLLALRTRASSFPAKQLGKSVCVIHETELFDGGRSEILRCMRLRCKLQIPAHLCCVCSCKLQSIVDLYSKLFYIQHTRIHGTSPTLTQRFSTPLNIKAPQLSMYSCSWSTQDCQAACASSTALEASFYQLVLHSVKLP